MFYLGKVQMSLWQKDLLLIIFFILRLLSWLNYLIMVCFFNNTLKIKFRTNCIWRNQFLSFICLFHKSYLIFIFCSIAFVFHFSSVELLQHLLVVRIIFSQLWSFIAHRRWFGMFLAGHCFLFRNVISDVDFTVYSGA